MDGSQARKHRPPVFISAPLAALVEGIYRADTTIGLLRQKGNLGIGTFNDLDGEMVLLDGNVFCLRPQGDAEIIGDEVRAFVRDRRESAELPVGLALRARFNPELNNTWFASVMMIIDHITMLSIILTGAAVIRERERGTDGLPARTGAEATDREPDTAGLSSPRAGAGRTAEGVRNFHPTVKPVALMRWLARLVTPPGGLVVDPFTGSGSTGVAAVLEGFRFAGAERDPDYHLIASARIAHAAEHPEEWGAVVEGDEEEGA